MLNNLYDINNLKKKEEVFEIMGKIPSWIIRWGISIFFIILIVLFGSSFFIKYPDVININITVKNSNPPIFITQKFSGKLTQLFAKDSSIVSCNQILAVINNPSCTNDIFFLKGILISNPDPDSILTKIPIKKKLILGEVQSDYISYIENLLKYKNFYKLDYHSEKIKLITHLIQNKTNDLEKKKLCTHNKSFQLQKDSMPSYLYIRGKNIQISFGNDSIYDDTKFTFEEIKDQINKLKINLLDAKIQKEEKENSVIQNYQTSYKRLINSITNWEKKYCLTSPIDGQLIYLHLEDNNANLEHKKPVFKIIPINKGTYIGIAKVPLEHFEKIKKRQDVIIHLSNYPDRKFGTIKGKISSVYDASTNIDFLIEISFPDRLVTTYGKELEIYHDLTGTAEIITMDFSLFDRIFTPLKKLEEIF